MESVNNNQVRKSKKVFTVKSKDINRSIESHPSDRVTRDDQSTKITRDSSEIQDIDENQSVTDAFEFDQRKSDDIDKEAEDNYVKEVVMDRIIKYIKIDDLIKKKEEEHRSYMKTIKEGRTKLEQFIIGYLDRIDEEYVQLGKQNKLTKTVKQNKQPIKTDTIKEVLKMEFKEKGFCENTQQIEKMVEEFIVKIEEKREIKTKKSLSRSNPEKESVKEEKRKKTESIRQKKEILKNKIR